MGHWKTDILVTTLHYEHTGIKTALHQLIYWYFMQDCSNSSVLAMELHSLAQIHLLEELCVMSISGIDNYTAYI